LHDYARRSRAPQVFPGWMGVNAGARQGGPLALNTGLHTVTYGPGGRRPATLTLNFCLPPCGGIFGSTQRADHHFTRRSSMRTSQNKPTAHNSTNVAGATRVVQRTCRPAPAARPTACTLTNGTPGVADLPGDAATRSRWRFLHGHDHENRFPRSSGGGCGPSQAHSSTTWCTSANPSPNPGDQRGHPRTNLKRRGVPGLPHFTWRASATMKRFGHRCHGLAGQTSSSPPRTTRRTYGSLLPGKKRSTLHFPCHDRRRSDTPGTDDHQLPVVWSPGTPQKQSAAASASIQVPKTPRPLVMTKSGPATIESRGQPGRFTLNVQNTGTIGRLET